MIAKKDYPTNWPYFAFAWNCKQAYVFFVLTNFEMAVARLRLKTQSSRFSGTWVTG